jgi:hypothetical protein
MIGDAGVTNPVLLTSTITSVTTKEIIAKYPGLNMYSMMLIPSAEC